MKEKELKNTKRAIDDAYKKMEMLPGQLLHCVEVYSDQAQKETMRHEKVLRQIEEDYAKKKKTAETRKNDVYAEARYALKTVTTQLKELRSSMENSEQAYQTVFDRVSKNGDAKRPVIGATSEQVLQKINKRKNRVTKQFEKIYKGLEEQESKICADRISEADGIYKYQISEIIAEHKRNLDSENQNTKKLMADIFEKAKRMIAALQPETLREMYDILQMNIPAQSNFTAATEMPTAVEMGYIEIDMEEWERFPLSSPVINLIKDTFSFALKRQGGKRALQIPFGRSFESSDFNKLITYDDGGRADALEYMRAIEMRLFMSVPCGKLHVTMIDPVDSGSNFSMFSCLGDDDKRIISTKIWSNPDRIKEQLGLLIEQIEHVHQDCLRGEYENIVVYNEHVGKNAEPLQALFVADFPRHFDKEAWEMLEKIVNSGLKCGIYTFIVGNRKDIEYNFESLRGIIQEMEVMDFEKGSLGYSYEKMFHRVLPIKMPPKAEQENIYEVLKNGIKTSDRIIINYDEISDELTKHPEKWFRFSEENGLDIPIGLEGASRTVQIHLGGELVTQHHALISGTIGAGKSSLLHTIIMSLLLRYDPEDVQIYLLDFKRGVEFKVYAESKLQNFRVISLDTEAEFGLAVLRYLEQEQAERAQEFHDKNCDNIEKYNEIAEQDLEDDIYKLPRIVVVIDEFHEMFTDSDSDIAKECAMLLEQVVRQGRALGLHMILASQTLPDHLSKVYDQIMNRIVLQSTAASAQLILDADNAAVNTLVSVDPGRGIFNDGGGNKDANHNIRIAYIPSEEEEVLLKRIKENQEKAFGTSYVAKPRLLLSTIQDDNENPLNLFVEEGVIPQKMELGCPLYLGEEIAMENNFSVRLTARRAQNVLILGSDPKRASLLYSFAAMSILFHCYCEDPESIWQGEPVITFFDFTSAPGRINRQGGRTVRKNIDIMNELSARFPDAIRVYGKDSLMEGIETLQKEHQEPDPLRRHYIIFAGLNRARRLLDYDSAYEISPRQVFMNLVKDGPALGYHFIVWANEPGSFCTFYNELIPYFDYRLVYDLKEEEYEQVIKSSGITTNYDNNIISYNPDEDNKKVRIYSKPLISWIEKFMERLGGNGSVEDMDFYDYGEFGKEDM